jgi:hypothetical protein
MAASGSEAELKQLLSEKVPRIRYQLWNGQGEAALERIEAVYCATTRQPMRWSAEGAHLLLQVHCAVLNNRLDDLFREWHPDFRKQQAIALSVV